MAKQQTPEKVSAHRRDILLLFSVPIAIVLLIAAFFYIPRVFANPRHDFIYCEGYYCDTIFSVDSEGRLRTSPETIRYAYREYNLRYYDVTRDATRPIQLEDMQDYVIDPLSKSPDGYTLQRSTNNGGFLFSGGYSDNWSLSRGLISKPITLGSSDIHFIGWVVKTNGQ